MGDSRGKEGVEWLTPQPLEVRTRLTLPSRHVEYEKCRSDFSRWIISLAHDEPEAGLAKIVETPLEVWMISERAGYFFKHG